MASPTDSVLDFKLALPPNWERLDVTPRTRRRRLQGLLDRRVGNDPAHRRFRDELEEALLDTFTEADRAGVRRAWLLAGDMGGRPVSATLLVSVGASPAGRPGDLSAIEAALAGTSRLDEVVVEHGVVDLPAGRAVRIRRTVTLRPSFAPGREIPVGATQFFVPIPQTDSVLVLAFSTPVVVLADAFNELFDAIAGTLQWLVRPVEDP